MFQLLLIIKLTLIFRQTKNQMKIKTLFKIILFLSLISNQYPILAQNQEIRLNLSDDGTQYIKATFLNQTWIRFNQSNPGTTVNGELANQTLDIGLRRTRLQLFGQISERTFFYTQFGMNNFNFLAQNAGNRKLQAFFHDALGEYIVFKDKNYLKLGGGLTIVNGLSRFTQPSIGTIASTDVPIFAQVTVDQTDEFARKLSVFARGQVGKLDYRIALSDPFPIGTNGQTPPPISSSATFSQKGHTKQYQGFFIYNLREAEPHTTPYMTGTYLGKKQVLNIEAGVIAQPSATWTSNGVDTSYHDMILWSVAGFMDLPVGPDHTALNAYLGYFNLNYGPQYIRNNGIMNPANGVVGEASFSGPGNAFPMFGTGRLVYAQAAYKLKDNLLGSQGTLMPYATLTRAQYDRLADPTMVYSVGLNWLIEGHVSKLSLDYQNRPVYENTTANKPGVIGRRGAIVLQYQVSF